MRAKNISIKLEAVLLAIAFTWSAGAQANTLQFTGRCDISEPTVGVTLDEDPREVITCREREGKRVLAFTKPVHLKIGTQLYTARTEWEWVSGTCPEILKTFAEHPEFQFIDTQTDAFLLVNADRELKRLRISASFRMGTCVAKAH